MTRLLDLVCVGLLTRVFPSDVIDEVIAGCDRTELRLRSLPAQVMAYFATGMAPVFAESGVAGPVKLPSKSAIFQARDRLGAEPSSEIETIFDELKTSQTPRLAKTRRSATQLGGRSRPSF